MTKLKNIQLPATLVAGVMIGAVAFTAIGVNANEGGEDRLDKEVFQAMSDEEKQAYKDEKQVEKQAQKAEYLQSKVDDGSITSEQKTQIDAWATERSAERESSTEDRLSKEDWQALTDEEREVKKTEKQADREASKAEAEAFFDSIGVDKEDLFADADFKSHGKRGGHGFRR